MGEAFFEKQTEFLSVQVKDFKISYMIQCRGPTNISSENSLINVYSIYLVKLGISRSKKISRYTFQNHLTAAFFLQTLNLKN